MHDSSVSCAAFIEHTANFNGALHQLSLSRIAIHDTEDLIIRHLALSAIATAQLHF